MAVLTKYAPFIRRKITRGHFPATSFEDQPHTYSEAVSFEYTYTMTDKVSTYSNACRKLLNIKFSFLILHQITASLSLMRRLPPNKIEQNLNGLLNLIPEETDELLQRVDQPLKEGTDSETVRFSLPTPYRGICVYFFHSLGKQGRKYLLCDYNRDGDSYR